MAGASLGAALSPVWRTMSDAAAQSSSVGAATSAGMSAVGAAAGSASPNAASTTTVVVFVGPHGGAAGGPTQSAPAANMTSGTAGSVAAGSGGAMAKAPAAAAGRGAGGMVAMMPATSAAGGAGGMMATPPGPTGGSMSPAKKPTGGTGGTRSTPTTPTTPPRNPPPRETCGNNVREGDELCDGDCPKECRTADACKPAKLSGSAAECDAQCKVTEIRECKGGDGCCPSACTRATDSDCPSLCGNGVIDTGEKCDPKSTSKPCPTTCDDKQACTLDKPTGSASDCSAECTHTPITTPAAGDACCPMGATPATDSDCKASCGDGAVSGSEKCDPNSKITPCPTTCDDNDRCTIDKLEGSLAECSLTCTHTAITRPAAKDGCCPPGATATLDTDCDPVCGDGVVDPGETCDPGSSEWPCLPEGADCDDDDPCTHQMLTGSIEQCTAFCVYESVAPSLSGRDDCCPSGETSATDSDCDPRCGNGIVESGEQCDPYADGEQPGVTCDDECYEIEQSECAQDSDCPDGGVCVDAQCTT